MCPSETAATPVVGSSQGLSSALLRDGFARQVCACVNIADISRRKTENAPNAPSRNLRKDTLSKTANTHKLVISQTG